MSPLKNFAPPIAKLAAKPTTKLFKVIKKNRDQLAKVSIKKTRKV